MAEDPEEYFSSYVDECRRQDMVIEPYDYVYEQVSGCHLDIDAEKLIELAQQGLSDMGKIIIQSGESIESRLESLAIPALVREISSHIHDRIAGYVEVGDELPLLDDDEWELVRRGYDGDEDVFVYYRVYDGDFTFMRRVPEISSQWFIDVSGEYEVSPELTMMSSIRQGEEEDDDDDDAQAA